MPSFFRVPVRLGRIRGVLVNIAAGVAVGTYLVPQAMAYGELAGVGPAVGLGIAVVPLLVYPLLGRHRWLSLGPESAVALMAAATASSISSQSGLPVSVVLPALAVLCGVILLGARLLKAAVLTDLLSKPVLVGYLSGIAVLMVLSQAGNILGSDIDSSSIAALAGALAHATVNPVTVTIAALAVLAVLLLRHFAPRFPSLILVLLLGAAVGSFLDVPTVGQLSVVWPSVHVPEITSEAVLSLVSGAAAIALVSYTDVVVTARAFDDGSRLDPRRELTALAGSQIAVGVAGGYPASASSSRTAIARASGATSRFYSYAVAGTLVLVTLFAGQFLAQVPLAVLGAVVIVAALGLVDIASWRAIASCHRSEVLVALACAVGVLLLGILPGVLVAVALSVAAILMRLARPHEAVLGIVPDVPGMHSVEDYPQAEQIPGLVVYRYDAPLFFANANDFYSRAMDASETEGCRWLVLNMESSVSVDSTGLAALEQLVHDLAAAGVAVGFARVKSSLLDGLARSGISQVVGEEMFFPTLPAAVDAFRVTDLGASPASFGRVSPVHRFARLIREDGA